MGLLFWWRRGLRLAAGGGEPESRDAAACSVAMLPVGAVARIVAVQEPGVAGERLLELGLTPGCWLRVVRRGLGGASLQVQIRDSMLSLQRRQAQLTLVEIPAAVPRASSRAAAPQPARNVPVCV